MTAGDVSHQPYSRLTPRLFIAVPLAEGARAEVAALVEGVREELAASRKAAEQRDDRRTDVRWVRMDGLHLTLRFLGPTPPDQVATIGVVLDAASDGCRPFDVEIAGGGAFPSGAKPRTLWLGISRGQENLTALAKDVSDGLEAAGWPPETRPFRGHLTLGRSDGRLDGRAAVRILTDRAERFRTEFQADRLVLFESVTGRGAARYEPVRVSRFGG